LACLLLLSRPLLLPRSTLFPYTTLFRSRLSAQHRFRLRRLEIRADRHARLEPPGWRREHDQVVAIGLRLRWNADLAGLVAELSRDRKSTRLNSSHEWISYAVFCLKQKNE